MCYNESKVVRKVAIAMDENKKELGRTIFALPPKDWSEYYQNYDIFQKARDDLERAKRAVGRGGRALLGELCSNKGFVTE